MGVEFLEIGVQIGRFVIFSTRTCYRSVCNHPFLVGMAFFLIFLYRSFPFAFSFLLSASPVLVCTAVLLGTLLSFGVPNIPEIEKEEKASHEIASLKTGVARDTIVIERDGSYPVERDTENRRDVVEKFIGEASSAKNNIGEVDKDDSLVGSVPLTNGRSREILFEKQEIEEADRELLDSEIERTTELNEVKLSDDEVVDNQYFPIQKVDNENLDFENDKSPVDSIDSQGVDSLHEPLASSWKQVDEGEEEDDEASDSGSDMAESYSPDASIADIIPMLDELHPLLDEETPQPAHMSHDGSDAASERSPKTSDISNESDEETENQEELEVGDDDEGEEEAQEDKEDGTKSAITWTEDDQKNLMDLGSSELERNQRLENLIARRRARKDLRLMAEKNLIDLETVDIPFNIAPISTARQNPFDLPYDSNDIMGLPPIPGSAPSILLLRRNPFDLPYDSSEEKPDLKGDSFQQELMTFQPKEPYFCRHESFHVGPSFLGPSKQERQDIKLRPYFVSERMASEGTTHSFFQRQLSELSDSKVSSVPETDSVGSAGDLEDKKLIEEDISLKEELISNIDHVYMHVEHESQSSEDVDSVELGQVEKREVELDEIEIQLGDEENNHEMESSLSGTTSIANPVEHNVNEIQLNADTVEQNYTSTSSSSVSEVNEMIFSEKEALEEELISNIDHVSMHVEHESQSFEDVDSVELGQVEKRDVELDYIEIKLGDEENNYEMESSLSGTTSIANPMEHNVNEIQLNADTVEQNYTIPSSSSVSEENEKIFSEKEGEGLTSLEPRSATVIKEPRISMQHVLEDLDFNIKSGFVDETQHKEPVYDSSPPAVKKNLSSFSISSDLQVEISETGLPPVLVKRTVSFSERESAGSNQSIENDTSNEEMLTAQLHGIDENDLDSRGVAKMSDHYIMKFEMSADQNSTSANASMVPESVVRRTSIDSRQSSGNLGKDIIYLDDSHQAHGQVPPLSFDADMNFSGHEDNVAGQPDVSEKAAGHQDDVAGQQDVHEKLKPMGSYQFKSSEDQILAASDEEEHSLIVEQVSATHHNKTSFETEPKEEHLIDKEVTHFEQDRPHFSNSDVDFLDGIQQGADENLIATHHQHVSESKAKLKMEEEFPLSNKVLDTPSFENHEELQVQLIEEVNAATNSNVPEVQELDDKGSRSMPLASEAASIPSENSEIKTPRGHVDLNDNILGEVGKDDQVRVLEHGNYPADAIDVQNINEDADEIKEIDEGLLLELDTVGDFSVKELGSNLNEIEKHLVAGGDSCLAQHDLEINSVFKQINGKDVEKPLDVKSLHAEPVPEETMAGCSEYGILHESSNLADTKLELPVLEARSIEDIDLAFKQLLEGNIDRHILPSLVGDGLNVVESKDPAETPLELHVVHARSSEDTNVALQQVLEGSPEKLEKSDCEDGSAGVVENKIGSSKGIEVSTLESGVQETRSTAAAEKPDHEVEASEGLNLSDAKANIENSQKASPSSGSSSSSSCSSSDSDRE